MATSSMEGTHGIPLLTVGSVAYDSVKTPQGSCDQILGGSATYFSLAASFFVPVGIVAVVGDDFADQDLALLKDHGIVTEGIERAQGKTFRWWGEYGQDMNICRTLDTQLNVFASFKPQLTEEGRKAPFLFLANIDPDLQYQVLQQMQNRPKLVAADTMNFWIEGKLGALERVMNSVDALFINESEARLIAGEDRTLKAARSIVARGLRTVVIKRGEYGVMTLGPDSLFLAPAYPVEQVVDPTGAGDAFAGGVMGYLAATEERSPVELSRAVVVGSIMASFAVESFGPYRLAQIRPGEIQERVKALESFAGWEGLEKGQLPLRSWG